MLVNPSKTKRLLISYSRTVEPLFPDLIIDGSVVEMVSELKILGVILDSKLAFEKQFRAIAASTSRSVSILRKAMGVFQEVTVVPKCFWAFILPVGVLVGSHVCFFDIESDTWYIRSLTQSVNCDFTFVMYYKNSTQSLPHG